MAGQGDQIMRPATPSSCHVCRSCAQLIQAKLADMYATTQATSAFVYATARDADAGDEPAAAGASSCFC
jgi:hypothetical protein